MHSQQHQSTLRARRLHEDRAGKCAALVQSTTFRDSLEATRLLCPVKRHASLDGPMRRREQSAMGLFTDPQTGVAPGVTRGRNMRSRCRCSMCPAIHITSRSWLRSSSTHVPSDPPLGVMSLLSRESCSSSRDGTAWVRYNGSLNNKTHDDDDDAAAAAAAK